MIDHDDPMLCADLHSEIEQAMHIAAVKAMVKQVRGMDLDQCLGREPQALPLSQFVELYPAPAVLDPHAGTGHVMVPRELLVEIWQHLWDHGRSPEAEALGKRVAEVIAP